jgi:hypothetical protein
MRSGCNITQVFLLLRLEGSAFNRQAARWDMGSFLLTQLGGNADDYVRRRGVSGRVIPCGIQKVSGLAVRKSAHETDRTKAQENESGWTKPAVAPERTFQPFP